MREAQRLKAAVTTLLMVAAGTAPLEAEPQTLRVAQGGEAAIGGEASAGTVAIMAVDDLDAPLMRAVLDLSRLLGDGESAEIRIVPVVASSKVQTLWDILHLRGIDMGILQADLLESLEDDPRIEAIRERMRYVTPLFPEQLYVVARRDIATLDDLAGETVSINASGTGAAITGPIVLERLGIEATLVHEDSERGIARVARGEIAAHLELDDRSSDRLSRIGDDAGLHLLPVPFNPKLAEIYLPSVLSGADYPNLIAQGDTVSTIAVGNLLATFNWPSETPRGGDVQMFVEAFFSRFDELKAEAFHPAWQDVNLAASAPGWTRLEAAQDWLDAHAGSSMETGPSNGAGLGELRESFRAFLAERGSPEGADGDAETVDALFESFTRWQEERARR